MSLLHRNISAPLCALDNPKFNEILGSHAIRTARLCPGIYGWYAVNLPTVQENAR